jgi:hypothetical protein
MEIDGARVRDRPSKPAETLWQLIMGFRATQLIHVAAKLGLADHLRQGPRTPAQLAEAVGAEPQALHRLLRALASLGVFAETADGTFVPTPTARLLQTDAPGSLRALAILYGEEWLWDPYGRTLHAVRTGRPAFDHVHGQPLYDYLDRNPGAAAQFQDAMSGYSAQEAAAIVAAYDFSDATTVVDVGGGHGVLVAALLQAHGHLSGVVFDQAPVVAGAERALADAGVADRGACVAGDFFAAVPDGGDLYLLKSVLHNWDDAAAADILGRCRQAMAPHARLLVIERLVAPGNEPSEAKLFDINMLVVAGGRERTEAEYRALFRAAGLDLARVIPTHSPHSLIEGVPSPEG